MAPVPPANGDVLYRMSPPPPTEAPPMLVKIGPFLEVPVLVAVMVTVPPEEVAEYPDVADNALIAALTVLANVVVLSELGAVTVPVIGTDGPAPPFVLTLTVIERLFLARVKVILPTAFAPATDTTTSAEVVTSIAPLKAAEIGLDVALSTGKSVTKSPVQVVPPTHVAQKSVLPDARVGTKALIAFLTDVASAARLARIEVSEIVKPLVGVEMMLIPFTVILVIDIALGEAAGLFAGLCASILIVPVADEPVTTPVHLAKV